jgi:hypothetical protein
MSARMMMMEAPLTLGELKSFVAAQVRLAFPDEEFLDDELNRIVGGALSAFNWGLIRFRTYTSSGTITTVETVDHLATEWMQPNQIILHVMDATGLTWQIAEFGVKQIEDKIDSLLAGAKTVNVTWLGQISRATNSEHGYVIYLSDTLRL